MSGYYFSNNNQYKQFLFISIFIHMYIWSLFQIRSILYDYNHQFSLLHTCVLIMKHYPMLWILRFFDIITMKLDTNTTQEQILSLFYIFMKLLMWGRLSVTID